MEELIISLFNTSLLMMIISIFLFNKTDTRIDELYKNKTTAFEHRTPQSIEKEIAMMMDSVYICLVIMAISLSISVSCCLFDCILIKPLISFIVVWAISNNIYIHLQRPGATL